ncbi:MAG: L-threonylcarbamoyladenylate synthase [Myxococcota bacterium]
MTARIRPPDASALAEAARRLRAGALVAFPTETVYGLGANALDASAVERIFVAKGRPASNPVIVHVESEAAARGLARRWPASAARLAEAHWPGPLTLVVERSDAIPDVVTAGGPTVALRVPAHPVALALLRACALPLAAPSANRSESISPTTAQHVAESLGPWIEDLLVLDGGPCRVGIESTVVDVTGERPVVLRPGMLRLENVDERPSHAAATPFAARSPGQMARHYAPGKPLVIIDDAALARVGRPGDGVLRLPGSPDQAATRLYAELHRLDADPAVLRIVVVSPPDAPAWAAIHDRLRRAASASTGAASK